MVTDSEQNQTVPLLLESQEVLLSPPGDKGGTGDVEAVPRGGKPSGLCCSNIQGSLKGHSDLGNDTVHMVHQKNKGSS